MATVKIKEELREFFRLMDMVETTDSGRPFKPNVISSCRVLDGVKLGEILMKLKAYAYDTTDSDSWLAGLGQDDLGI